ncbi:MAG TPA: MATE family efflux transporter [Candidatus Limnocylindria bacterium]|nr:MATE family efflux transporter [Candidatus Limnocylindria bacterium]
MNLLRRFFASGSLVAPGRRLGEVPGTREMYGSVLSIAMPAIAELVLMSLIGSADTIMVGQLGRTALAAVSLPAQPRMIMLMLFFALNVGVTAIVARRRGEDRRDAANRTLRGALTLSLGLSVVVAALAVAFAQPLMRLAGGHDRTPEDAEVLRGAVTYFTIMLAALPVNALGMCVNAALRGVGDTKLPMKVNILSNLVNVLFNWLLIFGSFGFPRMGITGAAAASVIGMAVGTLLSVLAVSKKGASYLHLSLRDDWRPDRDTMGSILRIGGNAALEQLSVRFGFFFYTRIMYSLGVSMFAAHNIAMQFLALTFNFADGLSVAGTTLVGQNLGRRRMDLSLLYGKAAQRIALAISLALGALTFLLRYPVSRLFINPGTPDAQNVILLAAETLIIVGLLQPVQMSSVVFAGALRGAADNLYVAGVMTLCVSVIRPVMALLAVHVFGFGLTLTWLLSLSELVLRLVLFARRFESGKWAVKNV